MPGEMDSMLVDRLESLLSQWELSPETRGEAFC
jgi:hypothetical protein